MWNNEIGIDLGTANVMIHVKGKGIVLDEPSVVAIETETRRVLAVGTQARDMVGRTPGNVVAIRPLKDGVIADFEITEAMLRAFIMKINAKTWFSKPRILICAPTNITSVEKKSIREAAIRAGAKDVILEYEPKAAAIGAGLKIDQPFGTMVIDIGGGTTDIAVLSLSDIVIANSLKVAGDKVDISIMKYFRNKYRLLIGERTAEQVKVEVGSVHPNGRVAEMEIRGRDLVSGLPVSQIVTSEEIRESIMECALQIVSSAKQVLERTPPELAADIIDRGIVMTGGGALLHGMDELLTKELLVPVYRAEDPMGCVVRGTGMLLDKLDKHSRKWYMKASQ